MSEPTRTAKPPSAGRDLKRTGAAGVVLASLACLVCGLPALLAFIGVGSLSVGVSASDLPLFVKFAALALGTAAVALLIIHVMRRRLATRSGASC